MSKWTAILVFLTFLATQGATRNINQENAAFFPCVPRSYGDNNIVCVCNATYCDSSPYNLADTPASGTYNWYVSSRAGLRLEQNLGLQIVNSSCISENSTILYVNTSVHYQSILGFGGAFTDAAGINIASLSPAAQKRLIQSYFDPITGSSYNLGRIPIGGNDFSTRPYTLADTPGDVTLQHFSLAPEDVHYRIPLIKRAIKLNPTIQFFATPWTAPLWMKTNGQSSGYGFLKTQYYQTYANYIVKFLEAYQNNNISIFAVTTGNEPINSLISTNFLLVPSMGWTPSTLGKWIVNNLGPTLASSKLNGTQILVLDDQRILLPWTIQILFDVPGVESYVSGIAVHWFLDQVTPEVLLIDTHNDFPNKYLLMSEATNGIKTVPSVILGSWDRGESYTLSIIEYMENWAVGWMDWNFALNPEGGPNFALNPTDSSIIVNATADEFYHQPTYYALAHFSKFVPRGSIRVSTNHLDYPIRAVAFLTPSQEIVVEAINREFYPVPVTIIDSNNNGSSICLILPARSMNTIIYKT